MWALVQVSDIHHPSPTDGKSNAAEDGPGGVEPLRSCGAPIEALHS